MKIIADCLADSDFADPSELILLDRPVYGTRTITFDVPGTVSFGITVDARFRLYATSTSGTAQPTGLANNGEVEDYTWAFNPTAIRLRDFSAETTLLAPDWVGAVLSVMIVPAVVILWKRKKH